LYTGDYSVLGLEQEIAIERKASLDELVACCGNQRDRFEKEMQRILAYPVRAVVVEATLQDVFDEKWNYSKLTRAHVLGSIAGWQSRGIPFDFAGTKQNAKRLVYLYCRIAYNRAQYRIRNLAKGKIVKNNLRNV
jgi:hypothetical protein